MKLASLAVHILKFQGVLALTSSLKLPPFKSAPDDIRAVSWLIVGGGIHGVHMAARLAEEVSTDFMVVDEHPQLVHNWNQRTSATGMQYLRSAGGYHLDRSEDSLKRFAAERKTQSLSSPPLANDYERPRLDVFRQHCEEVIDTFELDKKHFRGRVTGLDLREDAVQVSILDERDEEHQVLAEHVILAIGSDKPVYPDWVCPVALREGRVSHLLDTEQHISISPCSSPCGPGPSVAIVGGGLTAAHKALQLSLDCDVHLISRHDMREQQFDTHQDWMMDQAAALRSLKGGGSGAPKRQLKFRAMKCPKQRRELIRRERLSGTITAAVNRGKGGLQYAIRNSAVHWHKAQVCSMHMKDGECHLLLDSGETVSCQKILLATGFGPRPPGLQLTKAMDLPTSDFCGFPLVNENLQWGHLRLFVMGALAELELGPSSRNIAGARLAAERIVASCRTRRT